jgi:hypothetical protein
MSIPHATAAVLRWAADQLDPPAPILERAQAAHPRGPAADLHLTDDLTSDGPAPLYAVPTVEETTAGYVVLDGYFYPTLAQHPDWPLAAQLTAENDWHLARPVRGTGMADTACGVRLVLTADSTTSAAPCTAINCRRCHSRASHPSTYLGEARPR